MISRAKFRSTLAFETKSLLCVGFITSNFLCASVSDPHRKRDILRRTLFQLRICGGLICRAGHGKFGTDMLPIDSSITLYIADCLFPPPLMNARDCLTLLLFVDHRHNQIIKMSRRKIKVTHPTSTEQGSYDKLAWSEDKLCEQLTDCYKDCGSTTAQRVCSYCYGGVDPVGVGFPLSVHCRVCERMWHSCCYGVSYRKHNLLRIDKRNFVCYGCRRTEWDCLLCGYSGDNKSGVAEQACASLDSLIKCAYDYCRTRCHQHCVEEELKKKKTTFLLVTAHSSVNAASVVDCFRHGERMSTTNLTTNAFGYKCGRHKCYTCVRLGRSVTSNDIPSNFNQTQPSYFTELWTCLRCCRAAHLNAFCMAPTHHLRPNKDKFFLCDNHLDNNINCPKISLPSCSLCDSPAKNECGTNIVVSSCLLMFSSFTCFCITMIAKLLCYMLQFRRAKNVQL